MSGGVMRVLFTALALGLCVSAGAQERRWQIEAGASTERYDHDQSSNWREGDLAVRHWFAPRSLLELTLRDTRRYGLNDTEFGVGLSLPVATDWTLAARVTASPDHRVLARESGSVDLSWAAGAGWVLGAGVGRSLYDGAGATGTSGTSTVRLNVERYVREWRFAGGLSRTRLDGGEHDGGWRAQVDRYVGERGRVGVIVAQGRELENLPPAGAVSTRVRTVALIGAWPMGSDWILVGALGRTHNSDSRRRGGPDDGQAVGVSTQRTAARLGVQRDF